MTHGHSGWRVDLACALALFMMGAALAFWAAGEFRASGHLPVFYQAEFAPAALSACGKGFRNVDAAGHEALSAFLKQTRAHLACGDLGGDLADVPFTGFQRISVYLERAVAMTWWMGGVSWRAVDRLAALLAGMLAVMLYGIMRLGMGPVASTALSAAVLASPLHLSNVPELRDYAKAPFLLALVLIMGVVAKAERSFRQVLALAAVGGLVAGLGFGFRTDLLIVAVPFIATLCVFRAGRLPARVRWREGATASVVCLAAFTVAALPVLRGYAKGGNTAHVILLGFAGSFNAALGVEARHYQLLVSYRDYYQEAIVRSYASRLDGDAHLPGIDSEAYDRESVRYLAQVVKTFPADVTIRAYSAIAQVLDTPFSPDHSRADEWARGPRAGAFFAWRAAALNRLSGLGCLAAAVAIAAVAARSVRRAAFLVFLLVFFAGGTAIQFHPRHFFYLELMSWWALGVIACGAPAFVRSRVDLRWSAAFVATVALIATATLVAARHYQQRHIGQLFARYEAAPREARTVTRLRSGADTVTLSFDTPELAPDVGLWRNRSLATAYLLIDVNPQRCDALEFSALTRYDTNSQPTDFATSVSFPLLDRGLGSSVKIFIPVYAGWFKNGKFWNRFAGIEVPDRQADCVASISSVGNLEAFPVLLTAVLAHDWIDASHYQTMAGLERRDDGAVWRTRLYRVQDLARASRQSIGGPVERLASDSTYLSPVVARADPGGLVVDGRPEGPFTYLVKSAGTPAARGRYAIAEGELTAGGLTFGLLRNDRWYEQVNITEPARFVAVARVDDDGSYAIVLANNSPRGGRTASRVSKIGWLAAAAAELR